MSKELDEKINNIICPKGAYSQCRICPIQTDCKKEVKSIKRAILDEIEKYKFIDDAYSGFYMVRVVDIRKLLGGKDDIA